MEMATKTNIKFMFVHAIGINLQKLIFPVIFIGSVFITSDKFVSPDITPKNYFVGLFILLFTILKISQNLKNSIKFKIVDNDVYSIIRLLNLVVFFQACYGLFQFFGFITDNQYAFSITGSFDNPAGFAAVLSMGFPMFLFLMTHSKLNIEKYFAVLGLLIIIAAIILSENRTGLLSIFASLLIFFLYRMIFLQKFQKRLLSFLFLGLLIVGAYFGYNLKKDSANGRILIWQVSLDMFKDKPLLGHGYGMFQAKYMDYQAKYFGRNPNSEFTNLADNVKHPFNEFIKIAVEFGLVGLISIILLTLLLFKQIIKSKSTFRILILSGFLSFVVFSSFSYPLQYIAVGLLLVFYLTLFLSSKEVIVKNSRIVFICKSLIIVLCFVFIVDMYKQVRAEIKWKTIAIKSINDTGSVHLAEYEFLYLSSLHRHPLFLYNYAVELNIAGRYNESIEILTQCCTLFNDYDIQMLLADNYYGKGDIKEAEKIYKYSSNMIPCRFFPLFRLFELYKEMKFEKEAIKLAQTIIDKKIKVTSLKVSLIKSKAENYLKETRMK